MSKIVGDGYSDDIGFPETDITLVIEDKKIHINKGVLSRHSPVFEALFSGSTEREITLENKKAKDFVAFLGCFYPNMKKQITEQNVLQILPLAHEYQSSVVTDCEKFMQSMCNQGQNLTVTTFLDFILAAEKYDLQNFLDTAVKFCAHVNFDLLNGRQFERRPVYKGFNYTERVNKTISLQCLKIDPKTRLAIAENRLKTLEMRNRKYTNKDPLDEKDKDIYMYMPLV
ncbi:uncharacterized protein LOC134264706 [Saccostrea cucullata]|uniref:uncharacterized protein LOC134264706 n=1 Tax=Saccostrea cuccullata TaxID=36930 RepID=UPI002ED46B1C